MPVTCYVAKWTSYTAPDPCSICHTWCSTRVHALAICSQGFPDWSRVMDEFGGRLLEVAGRVALALGRGLRLQPPACIKELTHNGPHLLAPTGSDLGTHGRLGTVLAGCVVLDMHVADGVRVAWTACLFHNWHAVQHAVWYWVHSRELVDISCL